VSAAFTFLRSVSLRRAASYALASASVLKIDLDPERSKTRIEKNQLSLSGFPFVSIGTPNSFVAAGSH
jgi:hypothetical protein